MPINFGTFFAPLSFCLSIRLFAWYTSYHKQKLQEHQICSKWEFISTTSRNKNKFRNHKTRQRFLVNIANDYQYISSLQNTPFPIRLVRWLEISLPHYHVQFKKRNSLSFFSQRRISSCFHLSISFLDRNIPSS